MTEAKHAIEKMFQQREKRGMIAGMIEGMVEGERKGKIEGMTQIILRVLKARGIRVTQTLRQRIVSCTDARQLAAWAERAAVADSADDLFAST